MRQRIDIREWKLRFDGAGMNETTPRTTLKPDAVLIVRRPMLDSDSGRHTPCKKCGFETNREILFELPKKNCPRI